MLVLKIQNCRVPQGACSPGKFYKFLIALSYISRVLVVEK